MKEASSLPLITKLSQAGNQLKGDPAALRHLQEDIRASAVYDAFFRCAEGATAKSEFEKPLVIL